MKITVVGVGSMGAGYGHLWAHAGHHVTFTYSRDPDKLAGTAASAGPGATHEVDPAAAVAGADLVVLAVSWQQIDDVLSKVGPLAGQVVAEAFSPLLPDMSGLAVGFTTSGAETLAAKIPRARVVMALQNTFADVVNAPSRQLAGQTPTMFFCGDDPDAKATVATVIGDAGYEPVDAGPLAVARYLEPLCYFTVNLAYDQGMGAAVGLKLLRG